MLFPPTGALLLTTYGISESKTSTMAENYTLATAVDLSLWNNSSSYASGCYVQEADPSFEYSLSVCLQTQSADFRYFYIFPLDLTEKGLIFPTHGFILYYYYYYFLPKG